MGPFYLAAPVPFCLTVYKLNRIPCLDTHLYGAVKRNVHIPPDGRQERLATLGHRASPGNVDSFELPGFTLYDVVLITDVEPWEHVQDYYAVSHLLD